MYLVKQPTQRRKLTIGFVQTDNRLPDQCVPFSDIANMLKFDDVVYRLKCHLIANQDGQHLLLLLVIECGTQLRRNRLRFIRHRSHTLFTRPTILGTSAENARQNPSAENYPRSDGTDHDDARTASSLQPHSWWQ